MLRAAKGAGKGLRAAYRAPGSILVSLLPNVAFWNQKKIWFKVSLGRREAFKGHAAGPPKASGRWPKDMLLGPQGRREGLKGSLGRREAFKGSLLPNVAFWNQKKIWFKGSLGRREAFKGSLLPNVAFWNQKKMSRKASGRWPKDMLGRQGRREGLKGSLGRREAFKGSLLLNVAFWNQKKNLV